MSDLMIYLEAMKGSRFSEGDYLEGTAEGLSFSSRVKGYFAGGSSVMVKGQNGKWNMVWAFNLSPAAGESASDRHAAMKALAVYRRKFHRKIDRATSAKQATERARAETDWEALKDRTMEVAKVLKAAEAKVPVRFYNAKAKQLSKAWTDLDRKQKPGWDWSTFLGEIEAEIGRASK